MVALYGEAFQGLLILLAGITALTALIVFLFLGSEDAQLPAQAGGDAPASPEIGDAAAEADAQQGRKDWAGRRPECS